MSGLFAEDRFLGAVHEVSGLRISVTLPFAASSSQAMYGHRVRKGEVGQFVIVGVGATAVFGRITEISTPAGDIRKLGDPEAQPMANGSVQLLGTIGPDGRSDRGIARYPRIADRVFAAADETIRQAVSTASSEDFLHLGRLSVGDISTGARASDVFGRHLAVVGATGSGKSWTLAHLAETVAAVDGKLILLDPTGEFSTLDDRTHHLSIGGRAPEDGAVHVGVPHHLMREIDRNAFFLPSSGTQLPKLHAAVRSLRIAHAAEASQDSSSVLVDGAILKRPGASRKEFDELALTYAGAAEDPYAPFDLAGLSVQINHECLKPDSSGLFGPADGAALGHVGSMVARINDVIQTSEVMEVIGNVVDADVLSEIEKWFGDAESSVLRISLRNVPASHDLREIVVNVIGHHLLRKARGGLFRDIPLVVAIDEAHQFLGRSIGDDDSHSRLDAFELIAKEGRKYGLTLCIATQRPSDLPPGMLSQVGMMIVHRIADGQDRKMIEKAAAEMDLSSLQFLPGLRQGEAVVMGVNLPIPVSITVKPPTRPPLSDGPDYGRGWGRLSEVAFTGPPPSVSTSDRETEPQGSDVETDGPF